MSQTTRRPRATPTSVLMVTRSPWASLGLPAGSGFSTIRSPLSTLSRSGLEPARVARRRSHAAAPMESTRTDKPRGRER